MDDVNGSEIKSRREALGWSQRELARRAGVSQAQVSRAENERDGVSGEDREILARALGAEPSPMRPAREEPSSSLPSRIVLVPPPLLEDAVSAMFNPERHKVRDANAVLAALQGFELPVSDLEAAKPLARIMLDTAARLRAEGQPITTQALLWSIAGTATRTG